MYDNLERNTYNSYRLYIFVYERKRERVRASACMCVNIWKASAYEIEDRGTSGNRASEDII